MPVCHRFFAGARRSCAECSIAIGALTAAAATSSTKGRDGERASTPGDHSRSLPGPSPAGHLVVWRSVRRGEGGGLCFGAVGDFASAGPRRPRSTRRTRSGPGARVWPQGADADAVVRLRGEAASARHLAVARDELARERRRYEEYAWKLIPPALSNAHQHAPTHSPSTTSCNNDVHRSVPVNHGVCPGFQGVSDTVLTQKQISFRSVVRVVSLPARPTCQSALLEFGITFQVRAAGTTPDLRTGRSSHDERISRTLCAMASGANGFWMKCTAS